HQPVPVDTANAVSHRVQENLLLSAKLFGALSLARSRKHLTKRSCYRLHGCRGFAVFAQPQMAVKLQNGEHVVAHLHWRGPSRHHLVPHRTLDAWIARSL